MSEQQPEEPKPFDGLRWLELANGGGSLAREAPSVETKRPLPVADSLETALRLLAENV